ncbi:MAG: acetoacetate decarboxylase [Alphaproteobacteria bacterium]|nr:MAG: acetoacetate decarboxylase [Alphaproteobacteria bacterium]
MTPDLIRALPSMPLAAPTFPRGPYRFTGREYLILRYRTDLDAIRHALPEPLEPEGDTVSVQWLNLPDGTGFGAYAATLQAIPCRLGALACTFLTQMYVDNAPPLAAGREIWGYPMKYGQPQLAVASDTLTGTLDYAGQRVATGTMSFKHHTVADLDELTSSLFGRTQVNLKLIPDVDGRPAIAQLVGIDFADIRIRGAWRSAGRLDLIPAVNAPLADLPVLAMGEALHLVTDLTLPYGRVLHDYLAEQPGT